MSDTFYFSILRPDRSAVTVVDLSFACNYERSDFITVDEDDQHSPEEAIYHAQLIAEKLSLPYEKFESRYDYSLNEPEVGLRLTRDDMKNNIRHYLYTLDREELIALYYSIEHLKPDELSDVLHLREAVLQAVMQKDDVDLSEFYRLKTGDMAITKESTVLDVTSSLGNIRDIIIVINQH
jgi:hypothetical protein